MTNLEIKSNSKKEKINIYNPLDFKYMRKAGKLAAETLDFITKYVKPGVTTEKLFCVANFSILYTLYLLNLYLV